MTPPGTIGRQKSTLPGAEFAALRAQAVHRVQTMSGDIWTDYNFSDPGITILEQLCYALTEIPYRASFSVADLLCAPGKTQVQLRRQGLFPATSILPCNPVTANDFRRILIDRVSDVANVWCIPIDDPTGNAPSGLYHIAILAGPAARDAGQLEARVRRCYTAHRALCEDIGTLTVLQPVETTVRARMAIAREADPSDTLADALFALGMILAPEPARMSLTGKQALDPNPAAVLSGPLMLRGFIADDQLQPLPGTFTADGLVETLAGVDGVLTVDQLSVELRGSPRVFTGTATIAVPENSVLHLRTVPQDGHFTIEVFRHHTRCQVDPGRVRRRLAERWKQQRKTYALRRDYAEAYGSPPARHWDLASYSSVQDQFPLVYGIGPGGLPLGATGEREAQAKQLKAYLMPFDQMLADGFSQISFIRDLFSVAAGGTATYAWQSLRDIVPNVNEMQLLMPDYEPMMTRLVAETDPVAERRAAILDLLLSFYALQLAPYGPAPMDSQDKEAQVEGLIAAKQRLLRGAAAATRDRGRGANYLRPGSARTMAGAQWLSAVELGLLDSETGEARALPHTSPDWAQDEEGNGFGRILPPELWSSVEQLFQPLDDEDDKDTETADEASLLADEQISASLLAGLREVDGYRIGGVSEAEGQVLVCRDTRGRWWFIAEFDDERQARHAARAICRAARRQHHQPFYLVDWILLRHANKARDADPARYDFRVSAILASPADEHDKAGWAAQSEAILRGNLPAHVALECVFLGAQDMVHFDRLYRAWTNALRHGSHTALVETSRRLEHCLARHTAKRDPAASQDAPGSSTDGPPVPTAAETAPSILPAPAPPPPEALPVEPAAPPPAPTADVEPDVAPAAQADIEPAPDTSGIWPRLVATLQWVIGLLFWWRRNRPNSPPADISPHAQQAPAGALGFDTNTKLTSATAAAFRAQGFAFAIRYLSRSTPEPKQDLDADEVATILAAGLAVMAVQHVASAGWVPSGALGTQYGQAAAANAASAGLPPGVTLWLDLEGVASTASSSATLAYCNAWFAAVAQAHYSPGLYVGASCGLSSEQLDTGLACRLYWRSGSSVSATTRCGYSMLQTIDSSYILDGVAYDRDLVQADNEGGTPFWCALSDKAT